MGTSSSKDTKPAAKSPAAAAPATLPGWTGPPPPAVKIPLRSLVPEVYPPAATAAAEGTAPTAAVPVDAQAVAAAQLTFCTQLRSHGYAVIALDEPVRSQLLAYRDAAAEFLRLPYEVKQRMAPRQDDPLLRELGSVPNEGYVFTPKLNKEYIKLKAAMPADRFHSPELKAKFDAIHTSLHAIARKCWASVCTYRDADAGMTGPYIAPDVHDQSQSWADVRSSISVIRYWKLQDRDSYLPTPAQLQAVKDFDAQRIAALSAKTAEGNSKAAAAATPAADAKDSAAAPAAADAKVAKAAPSAAAAPAAATATATATAAAPAAGAATELPSAPKDAAFDESLHVPCGIHTDTGMLTYIVCAPVAGLQIQSRFPNKSKAAATATTAAADGKGGDAKASADSSKGKETPKEKDEYDEEKADVAEWLDVEKSHEIGTDLFVIAGRKCALFAHEKHREKYFAPTIHRVILPDSTERYSILYFQDCQK